MHGVYLSRKSGKNQGIPCGLENVRENQGNPGIPYPYICDNLMSGF